MGFSVQQLLRSRFVLLVNCCAQHFAFGLYRNPSIHPTGLNVARFDHLEMSPAKKPILVALV